MGDNVDPLIWIAVSVILILIDAIQMAYYSAINKVQDNDFEQEEAPLSSRPEHARIRVKKARENPTKLFRSVWFWQILTAAAGSAALCLAWRQNRFLCAFVYALCVYLFGAALPHYIAKMTMPLINRSNGTL